MLIVANWKLHFDLRQASDWLAEYSCLLPGEIGKVEVVLCPSYPLLSELSRIIQQERLSLKLGAQDVSAYEEGRYTGEVSAKQLIGWAEYVIVGHSERRAHFGEKDSYVVQKVSMALKWGLHPIVCVSEISQVEALAGAKLLGREVCVAYEPLFAIGSGKADDPERDDEVALKIKSVLGDEVRVLYGGSVGPGNVGAFLKTHYLGGFLIGGSSLSPGLFAEIVKKASQ